jgi:hypothetical protein
VYTITQLIVPYFMRNHTRNTRDQEVCDLTAYAQAKRARDDAAGPSSEAPLPPPQPARAPPSQAYRAECAEDAFQREYAELAAEIGRAKAAGVGQAAMEAVLVHIRRATTKAREVRLGITCTVAPLLKNKGDNSQKRKSPAVLAGADGVSPKKRRKEGGGAAARGRPGQLVPCTAPRARKPKQLRAQLEATPKL